MAILLVFSAVVFPVTAAADNLGTSGRFQRVAPGEPHSFGSHAWCYDDEANSVLLLAPEKEREKCELRLSYAVEKERVDRDSY